MMRRPANSHESSTISVSGSDGAPGTRRSEAPYFLVVEQGSSFVFAVPAKPEILIGRGLEVDLQLQHGSVSRRHARLTWQKEALYIQDLGSHNGIRINGVRSEEPQPIASGDVVSIGEVVLILHRGAEPGGHGLLLDRAGGRQQLADEVERTLRYQRPLTLLHIDLGQAAREPELLAAALGQHLRSLDRIAQLGPAELAVILPDCEDEDLGELVVRLQRELPRHARLGHCTCPADGCDVDMLLLLARQAAAAAVSGGVAGPASILVRKRIGEHELLLAEPAMLRIYDLIARLGPGSIPVLIRGETGSGKELAAAALHCYSPRSARRFLAINCAALPESLAESELFGHERGAFTGAIATKVGLLESAQGGTVFLDEIGDLAPPLQAKLLRALETRRIVRLGDVQERPIDVRLVAATHRDLEAEARLGRFRQDLYFRLAAAVVSLPPLRHRPLELPMLARDFLHSARQRLALPPIAMSGAVLSRLAAYSWPGNVRELKNDMEFLATTVLEGPIEVWHLTPKLGGPGHLPAAEAAAGGGPLPSQAGGALFRPLEAELRELERKRIREALKAAEGSQSRAAELLGMPRRTFFAKTKQYGLSPRAIMADGEAGESGRS